MERGLRGCLTNINKGLMEEPENTSYGRVREYIHWLPLTEHLSTKQRCVLDLHSFVSVFGITL